jgi:uroporphyrinogen decarboxylase
VDFLIGQALAGAQILQVFESWAGDLPPHTFDEFLLPLLRDIASRVKRAVPAVHMLVFPRMAHHAIAKLADSDYDGISIDQCIDPAEARRIVGDSKVLQGNLDPATLFASPDAIRREVRRMLEGLGPRRSIANLGHGLLPSHDPARVGAFLDAVWEESESLAAAGK